MKIDIKLPSAFERKWTRLLDYQGGDAESLALAGVELLWKKHGAEVQHDERAAAARNKRLRDCQRRLNSLEMHATNTEGTASDPLLVGSFRRRLDAGNHLTLPKSWIRRKDGLCRAVWLGHDPTDGRLVLLFGQDARKSVPPEMPLTMIPVDARGRIFLNDDLVPQIGTLREVTLIGRLRYAEVVC